MVATPCRLKNPNAFGYDFFANPITWDYRNPVLLHGMPPFSGKSSSGTRPVSPNMTYHNMLFQALMKMTNFGRSYRAFLTETKAPRKKEGPPQYACLFPIADAG
jgi:hypothetical protein